MVLTGILRAVHDVFGEGVGYKIKGGVVSFISRGWLLHCAVPYPPHERSLEIPRGRGVLQAKFLEAKYEAKLEFPGGMGVQNKDTFRGGRSMDILQICNATTV